MIITVGGRAYRCSGATAGPGEVRSPNGPLWDDITLHDVTHIDGEPTSVSGGYVVIHLKGGEYEFHSTKEEDA